MTGWFEANKGQPISIVTVGAIEDLGVFMVDYSQADDWPFTNNSVRRRTQNMGKGNGKVNGKKNGKKWEVLSTKTSFFLPDLIDDIKPYFVEL